MAGRPPVAAAAGTRGVPGGGRQPIDPSIAGGEPPPGNTRVRDSRCRRRRGRGVPWADSIPTARCMLDAMPHHTRAVWAASALLAACASPAVSFPNATPAAPRTIPAAEVRPDGAGPFPAVVLLHGCHGVSASTRQWAAWFRARGYVALIVDSWAPRGIRDGCVPGPDISNTERFDDAIGAVRWLQARPYVDRRHIGVIGWSNGGVFALAVVNGPSLERARTRGVVVP